MASNGYLSKDELKVLMNKELGVSYHRVSQSEGPAAYLREKIRLEVREYLKNNPREDGTQWNLYEDGLKIYTTINYRLQQYAEGAMKKHMTYLQDVFNRHWTSRDPWGRDESIVMTALKQSRRYKSMAKQGKSQEEIKKAFDREIPMKVFTWKGMKKVEMSPKDSVMHYLRMLNTGILSVDPNDGHVMAWVGGIDHRFFKYDHVLSKRQTGSVFKPIVYLTALEQGVNPYHYYENKKRVYEEYNDWSPGNSEDEYGGYYTMEGALSESLNTIAVDMIMKAGTENTIDMAHDMGISSNMPDYPSIALGTADVSLYEMVSAYSVFANGGRSIKPWYMVRIEDKEGNLIYEFEHNETRRQVADELNVKLINHMLQSVTESGTAKSLRTVYGLKNQLAGKTGTTQSQADGWFIGYNPKMVTGVWVGGQNPKIRFRSLTLGQGAHMALPIFARYMQKVNNDRRFRSISNSQFDILPPRILSRMEQPHYRETEGLEDLINDVLYGIEDAIAPRESTGEPAEQEEKGIYDFIRSIFKKKKKKDGN
jgi:penicillin-binding protein 1A